MVVYVVIHRMGLCQVRSFSNNCAGSLLPGFPQGGTTEPRDFGQNEVSSCMIIVREVPERAPKTPIWKKMKNQCIRNTKWCKGVFFAPKAAKNV